MKMETESSNVLRRLWRKIQRVYGMDLGTIKLGPLLVAALVVLAGFSFILAQQRGIDARAREAQGREQDLAVFNSQLGSFQALTQVRERCIVSVQTRETIRELFKQAADFSDVLPGNTLAEEHLDNAVARIDANYASLRVEDCPPAPAQPQVPASLRGRVIVVDDDGSSAPPSAALIPEVGG